MSNGTLIVLCIQYPTTSVELFGGVVLFGALKHLLKDQLVDNVATWSGPLNDFTALFEVSDWREGIGTIREAITVLHSAAKLGYFCEKEMVWRTVHSNGGPVVVDFKALKAKHDVLVSDVRSLRNAFKA